MLFVSEVRHHDINVVPYAGEVPITLTLVGRQVDPRAQQPPGRVPRHPLDADDLLELRKYIGEGVPGARKDCPEQSGIASPGIDFGIGRAAWGCHVAEAYQLAAAAHSRGCHP